MPNFMDRINAGLLGQPTNYGGLLSPEAQQQAQREAQMALYSNLLASGGWSDRPVSLGQAIGGAATAGRTAQTQSLDAALQANLLKSQISRNLNGDIPDAVRQYKFARDNGYAGSFEDWKQITQQESKPTAPIQEYTLYATQEKAAGRTPLEYFKWLGERAKLNVGAPFAAGEEGGQRGAFDRRTGGFTPRTTVEQEATAAGDIAGGKESGTKSAARVQAQIDAGLDAADALATVRRGRDLLNSIETGGIDSVKLAVTQTFGVTGADEAELSANLGKAVLAQLRATFGAQFTEKEGQRLAEIEAGFGKSTEGNKRLLEQAEKILDRAARRGLRAAQDSGDSFSAEEIANSMNFKLDAAPPPPPTTVIPPAPRKPKADKPKTETAAERAKRLGL